MRIVCIGGGPAGLYFGLLMKKLHPAHAVTVVERNRPYDTFGWGVVLSIETLDNLDRNDLPTAAAIRDAFVYWDDIAVHYRGQVVRSHVLQRALARAADGGTGGGDDHGLRHDETPR